jgi:molybdenum cofactor cytidylyltransferase
VTAGAASGPGEERIAGILLAAGAGSRFGGRKLLHRLPEGTPIGILALRNLLQGLAHTIVVIRTGDSELAQAFAREGGRVLECADAVHGMGHSLAAAVRAEGDAAGWVVALADMPYVRPSTIAAVVAALKGGARIVVPVYGTERGHPVGFAASCRRDLLGLRGDCGARAVLERYSSEVERLEVDDPGILRDIDTLEDLP